MTTNYDFTEQQQLDQMAAQHDSENCDAANGQPCSMCIWADAQEQAALGRQAEFLVTEPKNVSEKLGTLGIGKSDCVALPDFDSDWELAPRSMRNYVERNIAEYWYYIGGNAKKQELFALENADLKEAARLRELAREGLR